MHKCYGYLCLLDGRTGVVVMASILGLLRLRASHDRSNKVAWRGREVVTLEANWRFPPAKRALAKLWRGRIKWMAGLVPSPCSLLFVLAWLGSSFPCPN
ncbi:unnamed protein product [Fusarium graminearum]|nr:unnamed protein product [Fusarium graminearum]